MKALKALRDKQGYSQKGMATHIGVSLSMYEKVERGSMQPSRGFMQKLKAKYPDISIDDIFFNTISTNNADYEVRR